jgi:hypothetical protein
MEKKRAKPTTAPPDHRMTRKERAILEEVAGRIVANATPRLKVSENQISVDHPDRFVGDMLLMKALGTANIDFKNGIVKQLANVDKEFGLNFCMSIITGIEPRDQIETMLASQMAVIHSAGPPNISRGLKICSKPKALNARSTSWSVHLRLWWKPSSATVRRTSK